jgi:hypothetical protein
MVHENLKQKRHVDEFFLLDCSAGTSSYGTPGIDHSQAGGTLATPCLCNSPMTLSTEGGFSPRGSGSHGFVKTSPIAASMLSLDWKIQKEKEGPSWECRRNMSIAWNMSIQLRLLAVSVAEAACRVLEEREVCTLEVDMAKHPSRVEQGNAEN